LSHHLPVQRQLRRAQRGGKNRTPAAWHMTCLQERTSRNQARWPLRQIDRPMRTALNIDHPAHRCYDFYCRAMEMLLTAGVPFLVGGAFALQRYTGIARDTKDFDLFVRPDDMQRALEALAAGGYATELTYPHWLGKAWQGDDFVDIIFSSGNGVAEVDDSWFTHGIDDVVFGRNARLCPPEEIIWSKAFVMERERFDGADIIHLVRALGPRLDWPRLLERFGEHWRVLFSHLVLYTFVYPGARAQIPAWVIQQLASRLLDGHTDGPARANVCQGTLLSRSQYLIDVEEWGLQDARALPGGPMTAAETAIWTEAARTQEA
jgi:hypothetical protein